MESAVPSHMTLFQPCTITNLFACEEQYLFIQCNSKPSLNLTFQILGQITWTNGDCDVMTIDQLNENLKAAIRI
jgi:hypothetical protein